MGRKLSHLLSVSNRTYPADLVVAVGLTLFTVSFVVLPFLRDTPFRVIFGLFFVLFLPGYTLIAVLFPEARESSIYDEKYDDKNSVDTSSAKTIANNDTDPYFKPGRDKGIDGIERIALSFGLSIAIVSLVGLGLNLTQGKIQLGPLLMSLSLFTIGCAIGATIRRWKLPPDERFSVPYNVWYNAIQEKLTKPETRIDAALSVLLVVSILLAVGSVGYAVVIPHQGEQFTEFYLLAEDEGELVADNYPTEMKIGESAELILGISNQEQKLVEYTVVVQVQQVEFSNNETEILHQRELDRFQTTLTHNETWHREHEITPTMGERNIRVQYLLFRGETPDEESKETSYRDLHLWINVTDNNP